MTFSIKASMPSGSMISKQKKDKAIKEQKKWFSSAPTQIWNSRISWRIALSVFLTILTVQIAILILNVREVEFAILSDIREIGRSAVAPIVDTDVADPLVPPLTEEQFEKLLNTTIIQGVAVYSAYTSDVPLLASYGEIVTLKPRSLLELYQTYRSVDGQFYEVFIRPHETKTRYPYIIALKLGADKVGEEVFSYVRQTILIMLLMSAFVTTVLMIALGHWLLEPILFMRENLLAASNNPENPEIKKSPFDPDDEIGGAIQIAQRLIVSNADNIKQIKSVAEDKIHKLAFYDSLTGLPNRVSFLQTLSEQARNSNLEDSESINRFAVVALDIDHFKDVNDSMGHNVGDAILRGIGKRLRSALPEAATVARSGEDEYAITMPLTSDVLGARDVGEKVAAVIRSEPFKVFNESFQIRASIGVSTFPDDGIDPDQVLKNADIALNRAKEEGRDMIKEYSEDYDREVQQRFQMLRDLRDALENDELSLHFQPQFDLNEGHVIGAEALLRWWKEDNSKDGGRFISPVEFIPIAEQSGLIVPIGEWVMRFACERAVEWHKNGHDIRIAVNVSGAQFYQSDLVGYVEKTLHETGLEPSKLELEVTESVFMDDIERTIETLQNLHSLGVELAIDDFGTGYSSLSYLRQFPIDRLKIDQSFIRNALNNADDAAIAKTIVKLGHSLNLKVIAEGVETKEHEAFLKAESCDEVQGFRYSKPIDIDSFNDFIGHYNGDLNSFDKS